jgi:biotin carboxyl carrier protein
MNYVAEIDGREVKITLEANSGSGYEVIVNGVSYSVDARQVTDHLWSILHCNKSIEVDVFQLPGEEYEVLINGDCHKFSLMNEQRRAILRAGGKGIAGKAMITSPMPGKIVKLLVAVGQEVQTNDGLIIVEAMKMENEIKSSGSGRVKEIFVEEGDVVESGASLLLVE